MSQNDSNDDDRETLTAGAGDDRLGPADDSFDYQAAAEKWDGTPGQAEATLKSIRQDSVASGERETEAEARISPVGTTKRAKRLKLREPDDRETLDIVIRSLLTSNHFALVNALVSSPKFSRQTWDRDFTETERERLWDICCSFTMAEELVDPRMIQQAEQQRLKRRE